MSLEYHYYMDVMQDDWVAPIDEGKKGECYAFLGELSRNGFRPLKIEDGALYLVRNEDYISMSIDGTYEYVADDADIAEVQLVQNWSALLSSDGAPHPRC